jgi:hypothetical protein
VPTLQCTGVAMRLSRVFEPPRRTGRCASAPQGAAAHVVAPAAAAAPVLPQDLPEDLDQRVRQIGEWQLEDW